MKPQEISKFCECGSLRVFGSTYTCGVPMQGEWWCENCGKSGVTYVGGTVSPVEDNVVMFDSGRLRLYDNYEKARGTFA